MRADQESKWALPIMLEYIHMYQISNVNLMRISSFDVYNDASVQPSVRVFVHLPPR